MSDPTAFVSCIKVKGINLLPPVITPKLRTELQKDKQQAMKLEKRLQNCSILKKSLHELLSLKSISSDRPQSAITFGDNSHVEDLGIISARSTIQLKKNVHLTKEIIDISEYNNDGIKVIDKNSGTVTEPSIGQLYSGSQDYDTDSSSCKTDVSSSKTCDIIGSSLASGSVSSKESSANRFGIDLSKYVVDIVSQTPSISPRTSPKPRLIRSNSYTLEAPSPILLAHLKKCSKVDNFNPEQIEEPSILSRTWSSLENNYVPFEQSEFSSINTVYNFKEKSLECDKNEVDLQSEEIIFPEKDTNKDMLPTIEVTSPTIEVVQTDICVQQITVNANTEQIEPVKKTLDLTNPDCQLMQVLKKIPEDYSKQIIELIEKQRLEHSNKVDSFGKQFSSSRNMQCSTPVQDDKSSISAISASPSQSIYYSFCSSDTLLPNSPSVKVTDLENYEDNMSFNKGEVVVEDVNEVGAEEGEPQTEFDRIFKKDYRSIDSIKKEWAACVIGAHVKGYLTRRLLKTERVQSLINTIKDALICALQLHTIENIDEADIELHRRLINQVSAACYAFHDIFFSLSIPDQMAVISADRKRKLEKLRRPKSASSIKRSPSNSSRSSTRSVTCLTGI